ncbi:MAG: biotin-dependent carboxyltransferase family protein [Rhodobacter sp.]|nr:biotin-dependent carboxyltransferase family protein [Rhodobacter sp.]MCY4167523.1 biotin-dependent carboxyltransferase family protein [Rhodobacter sp.]MCY4240923.1 biotin-dependent carboxyltransferase family protein [Rhodobacter sp.]
MIRALHVVRCGPGVTVQDMGRAGRLDDGLSEGGAADRLALSEGAALLGQPVEVAALELAGTDAMLRAIADIRIALTGAPSQARIDGEPITFNTSYLLKNGQTLILGYAVRGNYSYLHVGGGFDTPPLLGSRSTHLAARIGGPVRPDSLLPVAEDPGDRIGLTLDVRERYGGGVLRVVPSFQTEQFDAGMLARLSETRFTRHSHGNRMGVKLAFEGAPLNARQQLDILSESIVPGDVQIVGEGEPFVLLGECQTTGGYPRIGTVIPPDITLIAQARPGDPIQFRFVDRAEAMIAYRDYRGLLSALPRAVRPYVRDPHDIPDLLAYQLVGGAVTGKEEESHGGVEDDGFGRP